MRLFKIMLLMCCTPNALFSAPERLKQTTLDGSEVTPYKLVCDVSANAILEACGFSSIGEEALAAATQDASTFKKAATLDAFFITDVPIRDDGVPSFIKRYDSSPLLSSLATLLRNLPQKQSLMIAFYFPRLWDKDLSPIPIIFYRPSVSKDPPLSSFDSPEKLADALRLLDDCFAQKKYSSAGNALFNSPHGRAQGFFGHVVDYYKDKPEGTNCAEEWLRKGVNAGDPRSAYYLAKKLKKTKPAEPSQYLEFYRHAALCGIKKACLLSADPLNQREQELWCEKGAYAGDSTAQIRLAIFYLQKRDFPHHVERAKMWLEYAEQQECKEAFFNLGLLHAIEEEFKDLQKSMYYYEKGAEKGLEKSLKSLLNLWKEDPSRVLPSKGLSWMKIYLQWQMTFLSDDSVLEPFLDILWQKVDTKTEWLPLVHSYIQKTTYGISALMKRVLQEDSDAYQWLKQYSSDHQINFWTLMTKMKANPDFLKNIIQFFINEVLKQEEWAYQPLFAFKDAKNKAVTLFLITQAQKRHLDRHLLAQDPFVVDLLFDLSRSLHSAEAS